MCAAVLARPPVRAERADHLHAWLAPALERMAHLHRQVLGPLARRLRLVRAAQSPTAQSTPLKDCFVGLSASA
eukprot:179281-Pleurochrysis_carterae.AAC.2